MKIIYIWNLLEIFEKKCVLVFESYINLKSVSKMTHFISRIINMFILNDEPGVSKLINFMLLLGDTLYASLETHQL